tara:strand:- start:409 stop:600 length:192 start_codon:yes stop_codon:yes gene_type:complete
MKHKQLQEFISIVIKTLPNLIELSQQEERYGSKEYDILYGINEKHSSYKQFKNNIKRILWRKN